MVAPVTDLETLRSEALNLSNYPQVDRFIGRGAHVRDGSPARNAAAIKAPVLMFHGDQDINVGVGASRLMERALRDAGRPVQYVEYKASTTSSTTASRAPTCWKNRTRSCAPR